FHSRLDGIHANAFRSKLHGKRLGESDHRPFRRGIGCAHGKAEASRCRGKIHNGCIAALAQIRHGKARAIELPGNVDGKAAIPILRRYFFHASGGPGNAGIVDQHIEPAERSDCIRKQPLDVLALGNIGKGLRYLRVASPHRRERLLLDIADVNSRPLGDERPRNGKSYTTRACGHQHAQTLDAEVHARLLVLLVGQGRAALYLPLKGGGRLPSEAKAVGWGSPLTNLTPTPRFPPASPFQGEVSNRLLRPYLTPPAAGRPRSNPTWRARRWSHCRPGSGESRLPRAGIPEASCAASPRRQSISVQARAGSARRRPRAEVETDSASSAQCRPAGMLRAS